MTDSGGPFRAYRQHPLQLAERAFLELQMALDLLETKLRAQDP